jgi:hypothetical protein
MSDKNAQKALKGRFQSRSRVMRAAAIVLLAIATLSQVSDRRVMVAPLSFDGSKFTAGINYPWNHYGRDFGGSAWGHAGVSAMQETQRVDADFELMARSGVEMTRWFVFGDARSGIKISADGTPIGLDEHVFADFDAAVKIARAHKIYVVFVLFDFLLLERQSVKDGVTMGGRRDWVVDARQRKALMENVVTPLVQRYGKEPIIAAWEVMNEPEWAMRIRFKTAKHQVRTAEMQVFVTEMVAAIHAVGDRPVTLGSASPGYLKYWRKVGLDLYQYHFYPQLEGRRYPSARDSHMALGLDKPLILGEFPTQGSNHTQTVDYLDSALAIGCSGALGWSLRATDKYSNAQNGLTPLKPWSAKHRSSSPTTNVTPNAPVSSPGGVTAPNQPVAADSPRLKSGVILEPPHGYQRQR